MVFSISVAGGRYVFVHGRTRAAQRTQVPVEPCQSSGEGGDRGPSSLRLGPTLHPAKRRPVDGLSVRHLRVRKLRSQGTTHPRVEQKLPLLGREGASLLVLLLLGRARVRAAPPRW